MNKQLNQFTPGPWSVNRKLRQHVDRGNAGDGLIPICDCNPVGEMLRTEAEANARLIAAAPELLAACEAMAALEQSTKCKGLLDVSSVALQEAYNAARTAIAKAKAQ